MRKILASFGVVLFSAVSLALVLPAAVNAAPAPAPDQCQMGEDSGFFSFPTWYRGLEGKEDGSGGCKFDGFKGKEIGPIVFTIALNVIDMALRLVSILAVGFIIYGGFKYIMSQGEPEETKKAQDTILKAVIGLVIAMISAIAVTFIVGRLGA